MEAAAAGLRPEPFETLKAWLAFPINLATVECLALVGVANNFVRGIEFGEMRGRFRIVLVGIGVQFFSEPAIRTLDVSLARTL